MLDKDFKNFPHRLVQGDEIASRGSIIPNSCGYRPDITIKNPSGAIHLILESERKTERKAFIGAMIHAAKYAEESNNEITLVFIMKENGNQTTVAQVSRNIRPYYQWIHSLGAKKLSRVLLISDISYDNSATQNEPLLSPKFIARCTEL